jgi:quercetin dioxygenase-like cupin family protein
MNDALPAGSILLGPKQGRAYQLGAMRAVFKADGDETADRFSISEWWLEPGADGPGAHQHEEHHDCFYVVEGAASFLIGGEWHEAPRGSFLRIPPGVTHDFANRSSTRVGLLNFYIPGGFERDMESIVAWFAKNG